ncbi:MAG: HD domain-containing protein [Candidatus Omnitrophica bacterium]|nr:HD domain-containing protein [Candidatus Omnitrophota bacterium]
MAAYGRLDLHQALINASKSMIRVKDPIILLRLITRFIDRQIGATHVAVLLYDKTKDSYVLIDSKGEAGQKIPIGYVRVKTDSPIIKYFRNGSGHRGSKFHRKEALVYQELDHIQNFEIHVHKREGMAVAFSRMKGQMEMLRSAICVPSYFKSQLVAVLILGEKLSGQVYEDEEISVFTSLANDVAMAVTNAELIKDLKDAYEREHDLLIETASALASAIDARDKYTKGHSERVAHYTTVIAAELIERGMMHQGREYLQAAYLAGLMHDVGKIGIKDQILNKPDLLTREEYEAMKKHVEIGVSILSPIKGMKEILEGAKYHHERWDGKGYPYGLSEQEAPILGRIIAVADAYDTMVTERPYQKSRTVTGAFEELRKCSGSQFDPTLVEVFFDAWNEGKLKKRIATSVDFFSEDARAAGGVKTSFSPRP